jgi:hypothetical protein
MQVGEGGEITPQEDQVKFALVQLAVIGHCLSVPI